MRSPARSKRPRACIAKRWRRSQKCPRRCSISAVFLNRAASVTKRNRAGTRLSKRSLLWRRGTSARRSTKQEVRSQKSEVRMKNAPGARVLTLSLTRWGGLAPCRADQLEDERSTRPAHSSGSSPAGGPLFFDPHACVGHRAAFPGKLDRGAADWALPRKRRLRRCNRSLFPGFHASVGRQYALCSRVRGGALVVGVRWRDGRDSPECGGGLTYRKSRSCRASRVPARRDGWRH